VETCCNGPVPGRNRTRNRTAHLEPLLTLLISNKRSFCQGNPAISDRRDGSDGTSYPLMGTQTRAFTLATGRVAYLP
jgi:hypothetical protein